MLPIHLIVRLAKVLLSLILSNSKGPSSSFFFFLKNVLSFCKFNTCVAKEWNFQHFTRLCIINCFKVINSSRKFHFLFGKVVVRDIPLLLFYDVCDGTFDDYLTEPLFLAGNLNEDINLNMLENSVNSR